MNQYVVQDLATQGDYDVLRRLSVGKKCAFEFGTFVGGSALAVLPQIRAAGGRLYCIDHFLGNEDDAVTQSIPRDVAVAAFLQRTLDYRSHLTLVVGDTREAYSFRSGMADMVFIDASHSYSAMVGDIQAARYLLKPGGLMCGHDYIKHYDECDPTEVEKYADTPGGGNDGIGYGVIKAVHEAFGRPNHESAVWWVTV